MKIILGKPVAVEDAETADIDPFVRDALLLQCALDISDLQSCSYCGCSDHIAMECVEQLFKKITLV